MKNEYESALLAKSNDLLHAWVIEYLSDIERGNNSSLARTLSQHGSSFIKLVNCPIDAFKVILGPDHSYLYFEEPKIYTKRITAMVKSLENGWKPSPLIATNLWDENFEISDGSHRVEALRQFGVKKYPTIIYFKDRVSYNHFTDA